MTDLHFSTADYGAATRLGQFAKWGMVPIRFVVGLVFLLHGGQKLFVFGLAGTADIMGKLGLPLPALCAAIVIAVELLGGLAILLGAFTRLAGAVLAFEMLVAIFVARLHGGFFAPYGYEFELTLLAACLTFALSGPGQLSLEEMLWRRSPKT
jgi:putative oxidoreductase